MSNSEADALSQKLRGGRNAAPSFEDLQRAAADEAQAEIERVQSGNDNVAPAIRSHRHSRADAPPRPPPPSPPRARRTPAPLPADSVGRTGDINEVAIDKMRAAATKADLAREVPWLSARPTKDSSAEPKWRIAVVTLNAKNAQKLRGQPNKRPEWMHSHSAHNKMTYCAKWGYDLIIENNDIVDKSRDVAWSKIPILKKWLPHYDYVMWIDMDVFFMRYDIPIETLIRDESRDLILSKDWHGVNFGVFILKSSAFSLELMELLWGAPRHWWEPWQEQSALMKMLDKRYVGAGAADERDRHVLYIPQRDMNAYPQHFSYGNDAAHYRDGDFIAHFPNCKAFPTCKTIMERFYQAALLFNNIEPLQGTVPDHIHPTTDPAKRANWAGANDGGNGGGGAAGEDDEAQPTPAPKTKRVAKTKRPATPPPTTTAAAEYQQQEEEDTTTTRPPRKSRKRATAVPVTMAKPVDEGDENVEQLPRADVAAAGADEAVDDAVKTKPPLQHKRGGARKTAAPSVVFDDADE